MLPFKIHRLDLVLFLLVCMVLQRGEQVSAMESYTGQAETEKSASPWGCQGGYLEAAYDMGTTAHEIGGWGRSNYPPRVLQHGIWSFFLLLLLQLGLIYSQTAGVMGGRHFCHLHLYDGHQGGLRNYTLFLITWLSHIRAIVGFNTIRLTFSAHSGTGYVWKAQTAAGFLMRSLSIWTIPYGAYAQTLKKT